MIKIFSLLFLSFFLSYTLSAQPIQKVSGTVEIPADNVSKIEDANEQAGMVTGDAIVPEMGTFTRISKNKDYGLIITRLVVDLGEGSIVTIKDLPEESFEVMGDNTSDKDIRNITALSVTNNKGRIVESGRYVTIDLDVGFDSDANNAYVYIVALNKDLGRYTEGTKFIQQGRTLRK